jgi:hypothetical protein
VCTGDGTSDEFFSTLGLGDPMMPAAKLGYTVNGRQLLDAEDALWSTQLNSFASSSSF